MGKKLGQQAVVDLNAVSTTFQSASQTFVRRFGSLLDFATDVVAIGGHRGMGANKWSVAGNHGRGRFRENTLKSFHEAVRSGATFVEFDVQTTADGVPVIWHDNYIVFGDPSHPTSKLIQELTYAEFCQLAPINDYSGAAYVQTPNHSTAMSISSNDSDSSTVALVDSQPASSSDSQASSTTSLQSAARARLLRQLQNGYPARPGDASLDAWHVEEEDHFPTLQQVFAELPEDVAFDIEIKMTTPDTEPCTPPEEVARQLDAILAVVDSGLTAAPRRRLLFSSFDPEVCAELKRRRPEFAVMFLSGGGYYPHVDPRRTSISAAVGFAAGAGLQGIILESATMRAQSHMVEVARGHGLQVLTYGLANDDPEWVRKQFFLGVHGVIVDDVAGVSAALSSALN